MKWRHGLKLFVYVIREEVTYQGPWVLGKSPQNWSLSLRFTRPDVLIKATQVLEIYTFNLHKIFWKLLRLTI